MAFQIEFDFALVRRMRELAVVHKRFEDLYAHSARLDAALQDFFREPAVISIADFTIVLRDAAALWNELTGEATGEINTSICTRVREAALALHKPIPADVTLQ
jgi:hypothetical protein